MFWRILKSDLSGLEGLCKKDANCQSGNKGHPREPSAAGKTVRWTVAYLFPSCGSYAAGNGSRSSRGEKEETRNTAEEKADATSACLF